MIVSLKGLLLDKQPTRVIVETGGIGYAVFISLTCYDALPAIGQPLQLFTHFHVREDTQMLFGFLSQAERAMFELLIGVTGVGPKLALGMLSGLPANELRAAIAEGDIARLNRLHGVGRKTAERVVLELRDRIDPLEAFTVSGGVAASGTTPLARDALMALNALGFSDDQARKMLKKVLDAGSPPADAETLVKQALASR